MKHIMHKILKNPLFSGSLIMMIGGNFVNFLNYVYHFIMGRSLGPINYGDLVALLSIINLLSMIVLALSLVVTKFISAEQGLKEVRKLYHWFSPRFQIISYILCISTIGLSIFIASFIHLNNYYLVCVIGLMFLFILPLSLNRAVLQGLLRFKQIIVTQLVEGSSKLFLGIIFVYWGWSVFGTVFGLLLSVVFAWLMSRFYIRDIKTGNTDSFQDGNQIIKYFFPVFLQSLTISSLYSTDIILVKHFFSSFDAGIYSAVSALGKIIFFASAPISAVMFPVISNRFAMGKKVGRTLLLSLFMTLGLCTVVLIIYWFFPYIMTSILYGSAFSSASNLLFPFGLFILFYTISYLITNFFLSIGEIRVVYLTIIFSVLQILLIFIFHETLLEVIKVSIFTCLLLVISLITMYFLKKDERLKF